MKKYLFGFLAIVLAVGFTAFTNVTPKKDFGTFYYWKLKSTANPLSPTDRQDPLKYDKIGLVNISCNASDFFICSIFAEESTTPNRPIITTALNTKLAELAGDQTRVDADQTTVYSKN